jgi:type II secretory pathway pseudopilin PulG
MQFKNASGFSIIEALVAAVLFAIAINVVAQLLMRAADQAVRTERRTVAATLAQARLEQLRAASFAFDGHGARLDAPGVAPTTPGSHLEDVPPYLEWLDRHGEFTDAASGIYVRRWEIVAPDADTRVLSVCVAPRRARSAAELACVWTIRVRQP